MKKLLAGTIAALTSSPAFAHGDGSHIHPHGMESTLVFGAVLMLAVAIWFKARRKSA